MMEMPMLFQEKMLAGLDHQIRCVMKDTGMEWMGREATLARLCFAAHDLFVLAAGLATEDASTICGRLEKLVTENHSWSTRDWVEGDAAERYWKTYSATDLNDLRNSLGVTAENRKFFSAEWVSPSILPLIQSSKEFDQALHQPKWLLYKAVTIQKGQLPEEEHNRMLAEAVNENEYAKAYLDYLKKKRPGY